MRTMLSVVFVVAVALSVMGCGQGRGTPRAVAEEFIGYMQNRQFAAAAEMWDYTAEGRAGNEDWDSFAESQRQLIIRESLAKDRTRALEQWHGHFPSATKVAEVQETGDQAFVMLDGGRVGRLDMIKAGDTWRITAMR